MESPVALTDWHSPVSTRSQLWADSCFEWLCGGRGRGWVYYWQFWTILGRRRESRRSCSVYRCAFGRCKDGPRSLAGSILASDRDSAIDSERRHKVSMDGWEWVCWSRWGCSSWDRFYYRCLLWWRESRLWCVGSWDWRERRRFRGSCRSLLCRPSWLSSSCVFGCVSTRPTCRCHPKGRPIRTANPRRSRTHLTGCRRAEPTACHDGSQWSAFIFS